MTTETIFSSYQPVQAYYDLLRATFGELPPMALTLRGLDVYILRMLSAMIAPNPAVLDMTGDATLGALRYFWLAGRAPLHDLIGLRARWQPEAPGWPDWLRAALAQADAAHASTTFHNRGLADAVLEEGFTLPGTVALSPRLIVVAGLGDSPAAVRDHLSALLSMDSAATIVMMAVGRTGDSPIIAGALRLIEERTTYRLALGREISPFFGQCDLAVLFRASDAQVPQVFERLAAMHEGNFSYAALLEQNYRLFQQIQAAQTQTVQLTPAPIAAGAQAPRLSNGSGSGSAGGAGLKPVPVGMQRQLRARLAPIARRVLGRAAREYRANYLQASLPKEMHAGGSYEGTVQVQNSGAEAWATPPNSTNGFSVSYHWETDQGEVLVKEGARTLLPARVEAGQTISAVMNIAAPQAPGNYVLELDIVQEGVTWFSDAGCPGPRFAITVQP